MSRQLKVVVKHIMNIAQGLITHMTHDFVKWPKVKQFEMKQLLVKRMRIKRIEVVDKHIALVKVGRIRSQVPFCGWKMMNC